MHIKSLTIQGFKSYRDITVVDPFSSGLNVVVGRNGAGKSNFFSAIRFVLSDAYTSLSPALRQSLLHEGSSSGSSSTTFSAYVEIVFSNTDNRFPTGKEEVVLRRTVGAKKDEYSLDRKATGKGEVMSLLEAAGFSRSNPYYIVPQGRITNLTNQKDSERLDLLKEVAGTKVYEDRRLESTRIMAETSAKRAKINELLQYIEDRLTELEEEKEELKEFQVTDRERRCLEYEIRRRELNEIGEAMEGIETEREREIDNANSKRKEFAEREKRLAKLDRDLRKVEQELELQKVERKLTDTELRDAVKSRTQIEMTIEDLEESEARSTSNLSSLKEELAILETEVQETELELRQLLPEWEAKVSSEEKIKSTLSTSQTKLDLLYSKQGRTAQFRTQAERDKFLKSEISSLQSLLAQRQQRKQEVAVEIAAEQEKLNSMEERMEEGRKEIEGRSEILRRFSAEVEESEGKRNELVERRKGLWKEQSKLQTSLDAHRQDLQSAERTLSSTMDKATSNGLKAVQRIARELDLDGYYGPLYQLFEFEDRYKTAIEVTAGNSLFDIVVDTDDTAAKILEVLNRERSGRVTFMPLNRLKPKNSEYPSGKDAIPMLKCLRYDQAHEVAFKQVFGKTIICHTLEIAGAYVRSHGLSAITLDGDKVDRKGALTGGYLDSRRSRLDAIKAAKSARTKLEADVEKNDEVKRTLTQLDQEITRLDGKIMIAGRKLKQAEEGREPLQRELASLMRDEAQSRQRLEKLKAAVADQDNEITNSQTRIKAAEDELKTKMTNALTEVEQETMTALLSSIELAKKELMAVSADRAEVAGKKGILEIKLNENLRRRRNELKGKIDSTTSSSSADSGGAESLSRRKKDLRNLASNVKDLTARIEEIDTQIEALTAKKQDLSAQVEKSQTAQTEDNRGIEKQQKNVERYLAKRSMLSQRRDDCNKAIRDLGVLPEEAFEKYTQVKAEKLVKQLVKANETLKKFAHVNKKAFEQYNNFTKQRDQLLQRREELDKSAESIEELIENLDQRKDEAIERTFKQVSAYFKEVFEKLVPTGTGRLVMQKKVDAEEEESEDDDEEDDERKKHSKIDNYIGVSIKVSFNSKTDEGLRVQQLSGGQKSLVALAMVFAIQKCDPAPFYLFDEIDANLDADRRTAVAAMIRELSSSAQFIVTTFRPELLAHADNFLGVIFDARKISSIKKITQDDAMEFVETNERGGRDEARTNR